jgi:hypothetical protein
MHRTCAQLGRPLRAPLTQFESWSKTAWRRCRADGRQTDTGKLVVRVTHLDGDGSKSIVLDVSGPLFFSAVGAGGSQTIEGTGNTLWVVDDAIYLVRGQATLVRDSNGTSTFSTVGYVENLCETLA